MTTDPAPLAAHSLLFPPHPDGLYIASALCLCGEFQWDADNAADLEVHREGVIEGWRAHVLAAGVTLARPAPDAHRYGDHGWCVEQHPARPDPDATLREAMFDEYGINVVDEALLVAIHDVREMQVNRDRWETARRAVLAALATPEDRTDRQKEEEG